MAVPSREKRGKKQPPDLEHCVEQIKLLCDVRYNSVKNLGQLYVAALGLIYHLRLDQETIFSIRYVVMAETNTGNPVLSATFHVTILSRAFSL